MPVRLLRSLLLRIPARVLEVAGRVLAHTVKDGFIHAGNLAYLSLLTLFPFLIVAAAIAGSLGRGPEGLAVIADVLATLPRDVAVLLEKPVADVLARRGSDGVLTLGILVGVWTSASFIETMRDILRRAYETPATRAFWEYRLTSLAIILLTVMLMLMAFAAQVALTAAESLVARLLPQVDIGLATRLLPLSVLLGALWLLFYALSPMAYRRFGPKWPGALLTGGIWYTATKALPGVLAGFADYSLTYGSLAGVIVALLYFFVIGLGFVLGAEFNAALAVMQENRQKAGAAAA